MKLFYGAKDVQKMYYDNLTEEQIDEMEKNGTDVTELRANFQERKEELHHAGETDLNKLSEYEKTPRDTNTDFFKAVAGKMPFFGKQKHIDKYVNAKLVYPVVVQGAKHLWKPGNDHAMIVLTFARDEKHAKDFKFLNAVADLFVAMRDGEVEIPDSCKELAKKLNDPRSYINENIKGETIDEKFAGADICVLVVYIDQSNLPGKRIPNDNVLPALYFEHSEDNFYLEMINGKFYKKG